MCKRNEECDKYDPNMGCVNGVCLCTKGYALNSNSRCNIVVESKSQIEKIIGVVTGLIINGYCMIRLMCWLRCFQKDTIVERTAIFSDVSHANRVQRRSRRQRLRPNRSDSASYARFNRVLLSLSSPEPTSRTQSHSAQQVFVALPLSSSISSLPAYESVANSAPDNAHISLYSDEPPNYEEAVAMSFQNKIITVGSSDFI